MNRVEIERALHSDRMWLLDQALALSEEDLTRPLTPSENDPAMVWSAQDHLLHLSRIEHESMRSCAGILPVMQTRCDLQSNRTATQLRATNY